MCQPWGEGVEGNEGGAVVMVGVGGCEEGVKEEGVGREGGVEMALHLGRGGREE